MLESIECFTNLTTESFPRETYLTDTASGIEATLIVNGADINYSVLTSNCTTSATAKLQTNFNGDLIDNLNFNDVLTSGTCVESLNFSGPGSGAGVGNVRFTMLPINSKGIFWEVSDNRDSLKLEFFTGYNGSNSGGFCAENCTCFGNYEKI